MALRISIGGIAKRSGFFAMCVGYDGKVLIPLSKIGTSFNQVIPKLSMIHTNNKHSYYCHINAAEDIYGTCS